MRLTTLVVQSRSVRVSSLRKSPAPSARFGGLLRAAWEVKAKVDGWSVCCFVYIFLHIRHIFWTDLNPIYQVPFFFFPEWTYVFHRYSRITILSSGALMNKSAFKPTKGMRFKSSLNGLVLEVTFFILFLKPSGRNENHFFEHKAPFFYFELSENYGEERWRETDTQTCGKWIYRMNELGLVSSSELTRHLNSVNEYKHKRIVLRLNREYLPQWTVIHSRWSLRPESWWSDAGSSAALPRFHKWPLL